MELDRAGADEKESEQKARLFFFFAGFAVVPQGDEDLSGAAESRQQSMARVTGISGRRKRSDGAGKMSPSL